LGDVVFIVYIDWLLGGDVFIDWIDRQLVVDGFIVCIDWLLGGGVFIGYIDWLLGGGVFSVYIDWLLGGGVFIVYIDWLLGGGMFTVYIDWLLGGGVFIVYIDSAGVSLKNCVVYQLFSDQGYQTWPHTFVEKRESKQNNSKQCHLTKHRWIRRAFTAVMFAKTGEPSNSETNYVYLQWWISNDIHLPKQRPTDMQQVMSVTVRHYSPLLSDIYIH
jgi:hypothetical protein